MSALSKALYLTFALALTSPLHSGIAVAQSETATTQDAKTQPAAVADAPAADGNDAQPGELSLGEDVTDGPKIGQTYVAEIFTDWEMRCVKTEDGNDPCQLYQLLSDADGNAVAEISIFNLPEGQQAVAGATVITPLETLLTNQVRLAVDNGQAKRYPFSFCSAIGCFSRLGFTAAEVDSFRKGVQAIVTISPAAAPDETVVLNASLKGFTAGFNAVIAANAR